METKVCTLCNEDKVLDEYNWKVKNKKKQSRCRECSNKITRKHYEDNVERYRLNKNNRLREIKEWFRSFKDELSCEICGEDRYPCLDFHHEDPNMKDLEISKCVHHGRSIESIKKEIDKCKVVCKNCHAMIHYEEIL